MDGDGHKQQSVIFLRSPDTTSKQEAQQSGIPTDTYEFKAWEHKYSGHSIAVLENSFEEYHDALASVVVPLWCECECTVYDGESPGGAAKRGPEYDGSDVSKSIWAIALTSKQAVLAIENVIKGTGKHRIHAAPARKIYAFTVGKATSVALRDSELSSLVQIIPTPDAGNAKELGAAITAIYGRLAHPTSDSDDGVKSARSEQLGHSGFAKNDILWFPCSAIARRDLENSVTDKRLHVVRTVIVYTLFGYCYLLYCADQLLHNCLPKIPFPLYVRDKVEGVFEFERKQSIIYVWRTFVLNTPKGASNLYMCNVHSTISLVKCLDCTMQESYGTAVSDTGVRLFKTVLDRITVANDHPSLTPWVCFFSPSGVTAVLPVLDEHNCRTQGQLNNIRCKGLHTLNQMQSERGVFLF